MQDQRAVVSKLTHKDRAVCPLKMYISIPSPMYVLTKYTFQFCILNVYACVHPSGFMLEGAMLMTMYYMYMCTLYPLQDGGTPLHLAVWRGHTTCVEHLLSTPGIDVNIQDKVSWSIDKSMYCMHVHVDNVVNMYMCGMIYPTIISM